MEPPLCLRGPRPPGRARGHPAHHASGARLAQRMGEAGKEALADDGRDHEAALIDTAFPLAIQKGIAS